MTDPRIHWSDEAQLIGYGETDSTGARFPFVDALREVCGA